jgi:hypothetical protein
VVLLWFLLNHDAMGKVYAMTSMPTGSRVMTTILSFFWLPNLCLWALSWLFGAGFALGDLGTFTLWDGSAHDLPPVPLFGIFPQAVTGDGARLTLLLIPLMTGFVIALVELVRLRGFNYFNVSVSSKLVVGVRAIARHLPFAGKRRGSGSGDFRGNDARDEFDGRERDAYGDDSLIGEPLTAQRFLHLFIVKAAYPIMAFCLSGILLVVVSAVAFACSNGALGTGNLAHVGVSVSASMQASARPAFSGMLLAWVVALVALCIVNLVDYRRHKAASTASGDEPGGGESSDGEESSDDDLVPLEKINKAEINPAEIKKRDNRKVVSDTPHTRS